MEIQTETPQVLENESLIPISDIPTIHNHGLIELQCLEDIARHYVPGAFIYKSSIRGLWMCIPK